MRSGSCPASAPHPASQSRTISASPSTTITMTIARLSQRDRAAAGAHPHGFAPFCTLLAVLPPHRTLNGTTISRSAHWSRMSPPVPSSVTEIVNVSTGAPSGRRVARTRPRSWLTS